MLGTKMTFADKLKRTLALRGLTQSGLADLIHASQSQISGWMTGEKYPSVPNAVEIARVLSVPLDYLFMDEIADLNEVAGPRLDPKEEMLLRIVRKLGINESIDRLVEGPEGTTPPTIDPSPPDANTENGTAKERSPKKKPPTVG